MIGTGKGRAVAAVAFAAAVLALGGCREEEQGRMLLPEKGTYLGKPDSPLTDDTLADLRQRAESQKF